MLPVASFPTSTMVALASHHHRAFVHPLPGSLSSFTSGFPHIWSTGDAYNLLVHLILGNGILAAIALGVPAIKSWYDGARKTRDTATKVRLAAGEVIAGVRRMHRGARVLAIVCMSLLLISQVMWLVMNFFIGNLASGLAGVNPNLNRLNQARIPSWGQFLHAMEWDSVSTGYILLSLIGLAVSYVYAARRRSPDNLILLFSLPGYIYGFCGIAGGTLTLIGNVIDQRTHHGLYQPWSWVILMYSAGIIGTLYVVATRSIFRAPGTIRQFWSDGGLTSA